VRFVPNPESIPEEVESYYEEVIDDNPDYSESQAWATAWSIYCKHKNPDSPHCRKDCDEYFQNAKIWVPENYVPHSREDLLGTKRSGYEPADMKWLIGQAKRMGGLPGYTSMERSSLDNIWYEVAAYRDWTEPVDRGLSQVFTADAAGLRAAKRYAKELVESDVAAVAEVRGFARFTSSRRGFDTHFIEDLGRYQTPPD
jgi:hypothetical protein